MYRPKTEPNIQQMPVFRTETARLIKSAFMADEPKSVKLIDGSEWPADDYWAQEAFRLGMNRAQAKEWIMERVFPGME